MNQRMILLRQENDLLNALKGQSFNQKSKHEALKILLEIHDKTDYVCMEKALCYIVRDGMLKGVGGSTLMEDPKTGKIHSDLILNNFGIWMSGVYMGGFVGAKTVFNMITSVGNNRAVVTRNLGLSLLYNNSTGFRSLLKVGAGTTAPTRTDFEIETDFGSAPENVLFESSIPTYNNTNFNWNNAGQITAGGSGTVNESVLQVVWRTNDNSSNVFSLFRDIISPGQAFVASDTIILEYTTQI